LGFFKSPKGLVVDADYYNADFSWSISAFGTRKRLFSFYLYGILKIEIFSFGIFYQKEK